MAWNTPKYDFVATDGLTNDHMNDIGENIYELHRGNGNNTALPTATIVSNNLAIDMTHQTFDVDINANSFLYRVLYTDGSSPRIYGNVIWLIFNGAITIGTAAGNSGDYYEIIGNQKSINQYDCVGLVFSGSAWHIIQ